MPAELLAAMTAALRAGDDALIESAFAESASAEMHGVLSRALHAALSSRNQAALQWRLFCIPLLIVSGGRAPLTLTGVLPDAGELKAIFDAHGTLGAMKNFALGNALASATGLAVLTPGTLWKVMHRTENTAFAPLDLPPAPIHLDSADEQVHLRFLGGVTLTSADAPDFAETAGNIAAWGMPFTKALAAQLAQPGLSLLPIPRPPMSALAALDAGRFACAELGLQLFLSNGLRKFRSRVGEAEAFVRSCADACVRIRLASPFDGTLTTEYTWPLQPGDDLEAIERSIASLLAECRVENIRISDAVEAAGAAH
ncbi:MAG TPA: hypothetical protein VHB46_02600 [Burkholderiales bacterium]|nr:hypothetical protein [Burkholderiales bacterium]